VNDQLAEKLIASIDRLTTAIQGNGVAPGRAEGSSKRRYDEPKGEVLTVTGRVAKLSSSTIKNGKRAGDTMWFVTLDSGFQISLFAEKNMLIAKDAWDSGRPLLIEYRENGKYNDLVEIGFAPGFAAAPAAASTEDDDSTPF